MTQNESFNKELEEANINQDEPLRITGLKKNSKYGLLFRVEWKERIDGFKPCDSIIENKVMRKKFPLLLLSYYEERMISLNNAKQSKKIISHIQY